LKPSLRQNDHGATYKDAVKINDKTEDPIRFFQLYLPHDGE
jgi:hypothetical protein